MHVFINQQKASQITLYNQSVWQEKLSCAEKPRADSDSKGPLSANGLLGWKMWRETEREKDKKPEWQIGQRGLKGF